MARAIKIFLLAVALFSLSSVGAEAQDSEAQRRAKTLIQRGDLAGAESVLLGEMQTHPGAQGFYLLGFVQIQQYDYASAESSLKEAVRRAPGNASYLHALAKSLLEQGKNKAAIDVLNEAIGIEGRAEYYYARAMCYLNVGEFKQAKQDLLSTTRLQADNSEAWFQLGKLYINTGENDLANKALVRALKIQSAHVEALYYLGLSEKRGGDADAALSTFEKVIAQLPAHVGALMNLGQLQRARGDSAAAKATFARFSAASKKRDDIEFLSHAVRKNPDNFNGRVKLAQLQLETGAHREATDNLLAARRMQPDRVEIYQLLAEAFRRQGMLSQAAQAEAYAERLVRQNPSDESVQ